MEIKEGGAKAVETGKEKKERAEKKVSMEIWKAKGMKAESAEPKEMVKQIVFKERREAVNIFKEKIQK